MEEEKKIPRVTQITVHKQRRYRFYVWGFTLHNVIVVVAHGAN